MGKLEIYVYTTKTWKKKGLLKVGHCIQGRHEQRVNEHFNAANPENPEILWVKDLPEGKRDSHIHKQLEKNGSKRKTDGAGKEWFYATLKEVRVAYNEVIKGVSRSEGFQLRSEQRDAVNKARMWFNKDYEENIIGSAFHPNRFLLNAKMRFGKCFTGIHIAKAIQAKKTIVVTYKPNVIGEWMEAVNDHIDFKGWSGIRAKEADDPNESSLETSSGLNKYSGPLVLCVSLQDLNILENGSIKERLQEVLKTSWDLLIFDEVHFGGQTERVRGILDHLKPKFRLDLSGTPFRLIDFVDFCPEQVFTYSYLDEQENKEKEIKDDPHGNKDFIYRQMPDLDLSTIEITDDDIQSQREMFLTDDMDFSLNELFKAKSSGFVHNDAVDHFINGLSRRGHDATALSVYGKLGDELSLPAKRHSVWWLNRVSSIRNLIKKLKQHPIFSQYIIINAAGGKSENDLDDATFAKSKSDILDKIKNVNEGKINKAGTITLTCRKFLTGVTIRPWDSILILNDIKSAESYFQAIFRVQSSWTGNSNKEILKPKGWVFDFAISRCLRTTYTYASAITDQIDQQDSRFQTSLRDNLSPIISGFCERLNMKRFFDGNLVSDPVTSREIFEAIANEGATLALSKKITSDAVVGPVSLLALLEKNPHLYKVLDNIKGYRTQDSGSIDDFIKLGRDAKELEKEKASDGCSIESEEDIEKNQKDFEKRGDKETKSRINKYKTKIKRLSICLTDFVYMTMDREYNIDHVIQTRSPHFFKVITGISKRDFIELCEKGFIRKETLNGIVRDFYNRELSSLCPEKYIYSHIAGNKLAA